jgi:hypothetical protein
MIRVSQSRRNISARESAPERPDEHDATDGVEVVAGLYTTVGHSVGLAATVLLRTLGWQEPGRIGLRIMTVPPMGLAAFLALSFEMRIEVKASYRFIWSGRNNEYLSSAVAARALPRSHAGMGCCCRFFMSEG